MRICIDARTLSRSRTGIGRYLEGLINALIHVNSADEYVLLTDQPLGTAYHHPSRILQIGNGGIPKPIWEQLYLPTILHREHADVYHIPHEGGPLVQGRWRFVATVYDLIPLHFGRHYLRSLAHEAYYRFKLDTLKRRAEVIITSSEFSRFDIVEALGISQDRVVNIPTPVDQSFRPATEDEVRRVCDTLDIRRPYVMGVGSAEPRKNLTTLLTAFSQLLSRHAIDHQLVLVGKDWRATGASALVAEEGLQDHVVLTGGITEPDLVALYTGATVFAYPSLFEGYGLPVLEAMACGTPVVASNSTSIPETAGGAASLTDPTNSEEIADAILKLVQSEELRARFRLQGQARVKELTWAETARRTLDAYDYSVPRKLDRRIC